MLLRISILCIVFAIIFSFNEVSAFSIRHDVNFDSSTNSMDAILVLRKSLNLDMSSTDWKNSFVTGDVNCDGVSNTVDAQLILRESLGLSMDGTQWCEAHYQNVYYVDTEGSDLNDGLSVDAPWKTIQNAAQTLNAGDIVYVKSGNYGSENITFANSGVSESKNITFEGCKLYPGDVIGNDWWQYGDGVNSSVMPTLNGGDRTSGVAFELSGNKYVHIKNFQITNYEVGVHWWSTETKYNFVENIIGKTFGDIHGYSGSGINMNHGSENLIKNSIIVNGGSEGIDIYGDNNTLDSVKVYCDDDEYDASTDYYIHIHGNNNVVKNSYIERVGNLDHGGAGIGIKGIGEGNLIENCIAKNLDNAAFYVRHSGVQNNIFKNCTAIGGDGFVVRDGANNNLFENVKTIGTYSAVIFLDVIGEDDDAMYTGNNNIFYNSLFKDTIGAVINFMDYNRESEVYDNSFVNCTIDGGNYLFDTDRTNNLNKMINSIVTNITNYQAGTYPLNFNFSNSLFWNNGFTLPTGIKLLSCDPLFQAIDDYHTLSSSPAIDSGDNTALIGLPVFDADENTRIIDGDGDSVLTVDMGIYEMQ